MTSAAAGWAGAIRRGAAAISIAPGHSISVQGVREKLAALDALSMPEVLSAAEGAWRKVWEREVAVGRERFGSNKIFGRYLVAQARKDWRESDRLFLDALEQDRTKYRGLLDAEETARAFSIWLSETVRAVDYAYRWIDPLEIKSCAGRTFESRIEADGTRRGFKALTVNPELWFDKRDIRMRVPVRGAMRESIQCVQYTVLPRQLREEDERIGDPKSAEHAFESEIRVPDGTPIPQGTDFVVLSDARIDSEVAEALRAEYRIIWPGA